MMNEYVVFDFETTGNKPYSAKIVQIGAILVKDYNIIDEFNQYVNPEMSIPEKVIDIHGITNEAVKDAPTIGDILPDFIDFIDGKILVGHNIKAFDLIILDRVCKKYNIKHKPFKFFDTKQLAKVALDNGKMTLSDLCKHYSILNTKAHDAYGDCCATNEAFIKLLDDLIVEPKPNTFELEETTYNNQKSVYNETSRDLQQLQGVIIGITCDNVITDKETFFLKDWLNSNSHLMGNYPYDDIKVRIDKILEDGILEEREKETLLEFLKSVLSPDFEDDNKEIEINGNIFCLSGNFNEPGKKVLSAMIESKGGSVPDYISSKCNCLVMGSKGSKDYSADKYGKKYIYAKKHNSDPKNINNKILIISENKLRKLLGEEK